MCTAVTHQLFTRGIVPCFNFIVFPTTSDTAWVHAPPLTFAHKVRDERLVDSVLVGYLGDGVTNTLWNKLCPWSMGLSPNSPQFIPNFDDQIQGYILYCLFPECVAITACSASRRASTEGKGALVYSDDMDHSTANREPWAGTLFTNVATVHSDCPFDFFDVFIPQLFALSISENAIMIIYSITKSTNKTPIRANVSWLTLCYPYTSQG